MTILEIKNLNHYYIKGKPVLNDIDIDLEEGEILSILGLSGCGKTTLLKIIAGLLEPSSGTVTVNDRRVTGPGTDRAFVFVLMCEFSFAISLIVLLIVFFWVP